MAESSAGGVQKRKRDATEVLAKDDTRTKKKAKFRKTVRYGNYSGYYGYRVGKDGKDARLAYLDERLFTSRRCLDIGCNTGHLTMSIGKYFTKAFRHLTIEFMQLDFIGQRAWLVWILTEPLSQMLVGCYRKRLQVCWNETSPPSKLMVS